MTLPMIIALAIIVFMVVLIMIDKLPFGVPPLLACLLMVVFVPGLENPIKTAFKGFSDPGIVMLASFMAIIAGLQKTSFISWFKGLINSMAEKGGFKAYIALIVIVMVVGLLFGMGSTAWYVLVIGLLSNLPESEKLAPSKVLMPAGFAANHPLIPFNIALQFTYIGQLVANTEYKNVSSLKASLVMLCLSLGFLAWCAIAYKILPSHPITDDTKKAAEKAAKEEHKSTLTSAQEKVTYLMFAVAVVGMMAQSFIGDKGYAITGLAVIGLLIAGVLDFTEIRDAISAPIIIMSASVIGVAEVMGCTGLTDLVGTTVSAKLGTNVNPFVLIFVFCILTSLLATMTGSTIGTVLVFGPMAVATCVAMGLNPTAAAVAITMSGWCGHFLPIDGMPAMIMGAGKYSMIEFWKFTIPQYFIRLLALTAGAVLIFPMK